MSSQEAGAPLRPPFLAMLGSQHHSQVPGSPAAAERLPDSCQACYLYPPGASAGSSWPGEKKAKTLEAQGRESKPLGHIPDPYCFQCDIVLPGDAGRNCAQGR